VTGAVLVVVMGVAGSGKTTVGRLLADRLGAAFADADDLHSAEAVAKMATGTPLDDEDRAPWLDRVGAALAAAETDGLVIACSALRRGYRDRIRAVAPRAIVVELTGNRELLAERIGARTDHFMPATMLESQLATLEPLQADEAGGRVSIAAAPAEIVEQAAAVVARAAT
jgi:gluconokinase